MFHVMISQLQSNCEQLEQQVRILSFAVGDLSNTISGVASLSGMEEIVRQMRKQLTDMQEEESILRQMLQVLNKVLLNYFHCEDRIINELEADNYYFISRDIGTFEIPSSNRLIR